MANTATTLRNPNLYAADALNMFCIDVYGLDTYDLSAYIPTGYETICVIANLTHNTSAASWVYADLANETIKTNSGLNYLNILVIAKRVGGA